MHKVLEQLQRANTPTPKAVFVFPPHVHPQENQKPEEKEERGVASVAQVSEEEADRQHLEEEELRASSPSCPSYSTPLTPPSQRDLCPKGDLLGNKSDEQHSSRAPEEEWREVVYPPVWREVVCPPEGAKGALGETRETCARQTAPSSLDILPGREAGREGGRGGEREKGERGEEEKERTTPLKLGAVNALCSTPDSSARRSGAAVSASRQAAYCPFKSMS